jgi:hypothetical protein
MPLIEISSITPPVQRSTSSRGAAVCHQRGSSCPERRIYRGSAAAMPRQNVRAARHDMACKAEPPSSTGAGGRRWTTWTLMGCASRSC